MDEKGHMEKFRARILSIEKRTVPLKDVVESVLDDYRAAAGHLINAVLARKGLHEQQFDRLVRFLKEHLDIIENASEIRDLYDELKNLRGSRVYGTKGDGKSIRRAGNILEKLKILCGADDTKAGV